VVERVEWRGQKRQRVERTERQRVERTERQRKKVVERIEMAEKAESGEDREAEKEGGGEGIK